MKLVIAEKNLIIGAITDALPDTPRGMTSQFGARYVQCGDYCLIATAGHAMQLKQPEDYDIELKKWSLDTLPIFFKNWEVKPSPEKENTVKTIGKLLESCEMVINAGDTDDEGQRLVDEVIDYYEYKGPVMRLNTDDLSESAMKKALASMESNDKWYPLGLSAYARGVSDAMVGFNASRYFSLINNTKLNIGRVQTPTLGLVVNRDAAIDNHIKEKYYDLVAGLAVDGHNPPLVKVKFSPNKGFESLNEDGHITDRSVVEKLLTELKGKKLDCTVSKKKESENAPLPFNLNKLNLICSSKFGYDPKQVMAITQTLRDKHKLITYNRSDCQYLHMTDHANAPQVLNSCISNLGLSFDAESSPDASRKSKCFDDSKTTAHTAIIPTTEKANMANLSVEEKNVYTIISLYYIAQFLPPCEKSRTTIKAPVGDKGSLNASAVIIDKEGYRKYVSPPKQDDDEGKNALSEIPAGNYKADVAEGTIEEKETKPPRRYTKATLAADMTCVVKYVDDPEIKRILIEKDAGKEGESGSIGTSATRAGIIDGLVSHGYLEENGKNIVATKKGKFFYGILPDELKKVDMTAHWWLIQESIKKSEANPQDLFDNILSLINDIMSREYKKIPAFGNSNSSTVICKCAKCGGDVVENSRGFYCTNKCGNSLNKTSPLFSESLGIKVISTAQAKKLMSGGLIHVKNAVAKETKKKYSCDISLNFDRVGEKYIGKDGKEYLRGPAVKRSFPERAVVGTCPVCGAEMKEFDENYNCANRDFTIWKKTKVGGTEIKISQTDAKTLLKGDAIVARLTSKNTGKPYSAYLILEVNDYNGKHYANLKINGFVNKQKSPKGE